MIFLCPFLHCKALRIAMYKRYINSTIIIIIIIIIVWVTAETIFFDVNSAKRYCHVKEQAVCVTTFDQSEWVERFSRLEGAVFRYVYGETFALFHSCVGNFDSISSWKVVGTLDLDGNYVTFKFWLLERLWRVWIAWTCASSHDDLGFAVLLGFTAGYYYRFYRIISVISLLHPGIEEFVPF